jgi:thiol-disulfide isomerase/thioredoxin
MKKVLLSAFTLILGLSLSAQWVSTDVQKRVALLEDWTGIRCGHCPDGHKTMDQLEAKYGEHFIGVGMHVGTLSQPTSSSQLSFGTTEGTEYATYVTNNIGSFGQPAASVGRDTNNAPSSNRSTWDGSVSAVVAEDAEVNLAVDAYYRPGSDKITIHVQGYIRTALSKNPYLTVWILQDNTVNKQYDYRGPWNNYKGYYRERFIPPYEWSSGPGDTSGYMIGDYLHHEIFRTAIGNKWGNEINAKDQGEFFDWSDEYTAAQIEDVPVQIEDMRVVAFLSHDLVYSPVINATEIEVSARATGINETRTLDDLRIYPNPFQDNATIEFNLDKSEFLKVTVFDVTGKVVQDIPNQLYNVGNHKINVDGNNLESGLYYVNIIAADGIMTRKLVLNR